MTIEQQIRDYLRDVLEQGRLPADDRPLFEGGFIPSLHLLDIVDFIEGTFGISLQAIDLVPDRLATISAMAAMVREKIKAR